VVTFRINSRDLEAIDMLVEAGIRTTRSDAAAEPHPPTAAGRAPGSRPRNSG